MPIGPIPPGCIAITANQADDYTEDLSMSVVCQLKPNGLKLEDIMVTSCVVHWGKRSFERIPSLRGVGVTVFIGIDFSFTGTIDDFTFKGKGSFENEIFFEAEPFPKVAEIAEPVDCVFDDLTCHARYGGVDPLTEAYIFLVHFTGKLTCVGRTYFGIPFVIVKACPETPVQTELSYIQEGYSDV